MFHINYGEQNMLGQHMCGNFWIIFIKTLILRIGPGRGVLDGTAYEIQRPRDSFAQLVSQMKSIKCSQ
jgi:hypothetical protein